MVTLMPRTKLRAPVLANGRIVLEPGSPVIWFTYPGRMHDIGIFHDRGGLATGWYANILTPVEMRGPLDWSTTDLFLDVWVDERGATLLDEDQFEEAIAQGWIEETVATAARNEATRLLDQASTGAFPPAEVRAWSLARAQALHSPTRCSAGSVE
jgi:predicted RNA-binding protein associated with RNAse of E/G family